MPVNIRGEWCQNHIRRASLHFDGFSVSRTRVEGYGHSGPTRYEVADSLFNVEDEVEDSRSEH